MLRTLPCRRRGGQEVLTERECVRRRAREIPCRANFKVRRRSALSKLGDDAILLVATRTPMSL